MNSFLGTETCKKLNNFFKQITTLLIVFSIALPQNLFANNSPSDDLRESERAELAPERIDFNALTPESLNRIAIQPESLQTLNTTGMFEGQRIDIDVIRGEFQSDEADKILKVLNELKGQIEEAYRLNPNTKFEFVHISKEGDTKLNLAAEEILNFLKDINNNTQDKSEAINSGSWEKIKNFFTLVFNKTSKSDIYWALARFGAGTTSATLSFHFASGFPLSISLILGTTLGTASGSVGLFIERFTDWLEKNKPTPHKGARNYLSSIETALFVSPLLIGLQHNGLFSVEGMTLLLGTAAITPVIQSTYYKLRSKFPKVGLWYKWYAVEAAFLTVPYMMMPGWDIYTNSITKTIASTFLTALFSTMSQGVWDVLLTDKIRAPYLKEAMKKDIAEFSSKVSGRHIYQNNAQALDNLLHSDENKTRAFYDDLSKIVQMLPLHKTVKLDQLVEYIKNSRISAAMKKDLALESERLTGINIFNLSKNTRNKFTREHEFAVRERFKKYFFIASIISVTSAVATNTGVYIGNDLLKYSGLAGLAALGVSGVGTWAYLNNKLGLFVSVLSAASVGAIEYGKYAGSDILSQAGIGGLAFSAAAGVAWLHVKYKNIKAKRQERAIQDTITNISQKREKQQNTTEAPRRGLEIPTRQQTLENVLRSQERVKMCASLFAK